MGKKIVFFSFVVQMLGASALYAQNYADKAYYLVDGLNLSTLSEADLKIMDSALTLYHSTDIDSNKIKAVNLIVEASWDDNLWPKYNQWILNRTTQLLSDNSIEKGSKKYVYYMSNKASALNNVGFLHKNHLEYAEGLKYYQRSLSIAKDLKNKALEATTLNNIGYIYKQQGEILKAVEHYEQSILLKREVGDMKGVANSLNNLGVIYRRVGDIEHALENYFEALSVLEKLGEHPNIATLQSNIGLIYENLGDTVTALEYYKKSLVIEQKINYPRGEAILLNNLAGLYSKTGNTPKALNYLMKALKINEELNDLGGLASSYGRIGTLYFDEENYKQALIYFKQALDRNEALEHSDGIASNCYSIAKCQFYLGRKESAKMYAERSMKMAKELQFPEVIRDAAEVLKTIYQDQGKWKEAFEYGDIYTRMKDSIRNTQNEETALIQRTNYDIQKREREIELLNTKNDVLEKDKEIKNLKLSRSNYLMIVSLIALVIVSLLALIIYRGLRKQREMNQILEVQKNAIAVQNDEKGAMLKEIHHRVKNNLQIISSLLRIQSREVTDEKVLGMFENAQNRVVTIAEIHERMYGVDNLKYIDANDYFSSLVEGLIRGYSIEGKICVNVTVDELDLGIKTLIPLGLIINEIVNNSLKHAFKLIESPCISLELRQLGPKDLEMIIGDNGNGYNPLEISGGLGLELVDTFVEQLNGRLELHVGDGTEYRIRFNQID